MAKNKSGTFVHVHTDHGVVVVAPDGDFPEGAEYDKSLTQESEEVELEPAGVHQRASAPVDSSEWKGVTSAQIKDGLAAREVEFGDRDRKDALVERATEAGLTPADFE
jgi:hypothetical protein